MGDKPTRSGKTGAIITTTTTRARKKGGLDLSGLKDPLKIATLFPMTPAQNYCVYMGPGSGIATKLQFNTFFDQDHTIAGWFMPQYPRGGHGALFASNGSDQFFVGQGDYRSGNCVITALGLADGIAPKSGDPVLTIYAGAAKRVYLAPSWQVGAWQHLAVVRSGNVLTLYLNGAKLQPVTVATNKDRKGKVVSKTVTPTSDLQIPGSINGADLGNLILGRSRHPILTAYAQAYGLLDDVAVFDHALTPAEIATLVAKKRLSGYEPGIVAGWGFDTPLAGKLLPATLAGPLDESDVGPNLKVSADRNGAADQWFFDSQLIIAANTKIVKFPFPPGEAWKVVQGYCNAVTSHNGDSAAFCYDLSKADGPSGGSPVFASEGGFVVTYLRNGTVNPDIKREPNTVQLFNEADDLAITYMHFAGNSLTSAVVNGDAVPADPDTWVTPWPGIERMLFTGTELGLVGPGGNHLHTGALESVVDQLSVQVAQNTIPMAYKEIEVLSPGGSDWHSVPICYIPKEGDQIRAV